MSVNNVVENNYLHGNLLEAIQVGLKKLGKTTGNITIEDLSAVDEFHIGGRAATDHFLSQINFPVGGHLLDVGCGLGGASRYVADKYKHKVTGIDLTKEYIDTGNVLSEWVNLENMVNLYHESALSLPFDDETFDGGYMLHVGMNIENKDALFNEIQRVLRPGSFFGVYDIMQNKQGHLTYPVPWAAEESDSKLATPEVYKTALTNSGFKVLKEDNRAEFALDFFKVLKAKTEANGGPPPLGLHTLMQNSTPIKVKNMIDNIVADLINPVEIIVQK